MALPSKQKTIVSGRKISKSISTYSVYCLAESSSRCRIRYIGITKQKISRRLYGHLWDAKRPYRKEHKTNWIRRCIANGIRIRIRSLRSDLSLEEACYIEQSCIAKYSRRLVNIHEGGTSGYAGLPVDAKMRHKQNTRQALDKIPAHVRLSAAKKARDANSAAAKLRLEARTAPSLCRGGFNTSGVFGNHIVRLYAPSSDSRKFYVVIDGKHSRSRSLRSVINMISHMVWSAMQQKPMDSYVPEVH